MRKNISEMWNMFLDDGSQIFEDEELLDAEMVQGKLLTIAHTFEDFKEPALTINEACKKDISISESQQEATTSKEGASPPISSDEEIIVDSDEGKQFTKAEREMFSSLKGI